MPVTVMTGLLLAHGSTWAGVGLTICTWGGVTSKLAATLYAACKVEVRPALSVTVPISTSSRSVAVGRTKVRVTKPVTATD
jgi:hypothetical protein